jgi:mRNA interferase RelE/StbE
LRAIPLHFRRKILATAKRLQSEPRGGGIKKLEGGSGYRLKIGVYRILFEIDDAAKTVKIYRIRHRKDAYR